MRPRRRLVLRLLSRRPIEVADSARRDANNLNNRRCSNSYWRFEMTHLLASASDRSIHRLSAVRIVLLIGSTMVPIAATGCAAGPNESVGETSRQSSAITNGTVDTT